MARINIDTGTLGNPATGDTLRTAMTKINTNFAEVYSLVQDGSSGLIATDVTNGDLKLQANGTGTIEIDQLSISGDSITTIATNGSVDITGNGTGGVNIEALNFSGTSISSADSSSINLNENVDIDGDLNVTGTITGTFSATGIGDITAVGSTLVTPSNADLTLSPGGTGAVVLPGITINDNNITGTRSNDDINITPSGTGNVNLNGDTVRVGDNDADATITTQGTGDLTLSTNSGTNSGTILLRDGANGDIIVETDGTGDILLKSGNRVGIGSVNQPDTLLHLKDTNSVITLQRTNDANTPGLSFQQSGGNVRGVIKLDGTSGTSNEIFMQTYDGSSLAERFRVTHTGAKVSGTLNVDDGISITDNTITTSASNANLELSAAGSGEVTTDTNLKLISGTPFLKIQRTDNANVPGIDFLGQAGTSGAKILFDGTSGTANELSFETFTVAGGLAEAFRVKTDGAKVTGTLDIDGGISITDNSISATRSNDNLELKASGTGSVSIDGIQISGTEISSSDSTQVTIKENLHVTGNISGTITGTVATIDADSTTVSNLEVDNFKAATIVTEGEGIGSNDNDTTIPTSAAVKDYVDNNAGGTTGDLAITGSTISAPSNADLTLNAGGTGSVDIEGIQIKGTEISSNDSTQVTIKENLHVTGNITGTINANQLSGALPAISGSNLTGVAKTAFTAVQIGGGNTLVADDASDTLTIHPGNNVTITDDQALDSFTISVNGMGDLTFVGSTIISPSNADITLDPAGTGGIVAQGPVTFNAGYIEKINTLTSSSTITVNCALASIHKVTLATNTEFNITNLPTGGTVTLIITQDGTGSRTATFGTDGSTAVKFPGGAPTLSTGANDIDVVTIVNDGTNFLGNCAKNYS